MSFCSNAFCEEGNRENDILTEKNCNQVYTSQALSFDPIPFGNRYGQNGVTYLENGDVLLRFFAPNASKVEFSGMPGSLAGEEKRPLNRCKGGYWELTLSGLPTKYLAIIFYVDGIEAMNPCVNIGAGYDRMINYVDLPHAEGKFYEVNRVPHGSIRYEFYHSSLTGRPRDCLVYTPPGYDGEKKEVSCFISPTRRGRERDKLVLAGKVEFHFRQSPRRRKGGRDDRRVQLRRGLPKR